MPVPPTVMLADDDDLIKAERLLGWPMVVKIPDGSFSRGVHKVENAEELKKLSDKLFEDTDLLLAQKFMPTKFDWRVGVLDGEPLFVCQYQMARGHWQIIKHGPNGAREGGSKTLAIGDAPPRGHRRGAQGGVRDRSRSLWRGHQGNRRRDRRHRDQRQPEFRTRGRGPDRQGRDLDANPQLVHQADRRLRRAALRRGPTARFLKPVFLPSASDWRLGYKPSCRRIEARRGLGGNS